MALCSLLPYIVSLYLLFFFHVSTSKIISRFPASIIRRPEQLSIVPNGVTSYKTKYSTQTLDHFNFNPQSYETFQQRYLINAKYWGGPGRNAPIFVYTGNEGDIEWFAQNTGFMYEVAPKFKALLVFIEHRFYGKSVPYGDKKIAYKNASTQGYLSSTQALADYATLILDLKRNLSAFDSPVVVFGGSYGGMLAAWFRLKYPHVAIGALASSSPILNFEGLTSPYSFNNIVTKDFEGESENCYKVIKESWTQIQETALQPGGLQKLRSSFGLCKSTSFSADVLAAWLHSAFIYTAMTDYPAPSNFINPLPAYPVRQMCKAIDDPKLGSDTFAKLHGAMNIYYNYSGNKKCFDLDSHSDKHGLDEWTWQACTEMVLPTDGNSKESIFPASTYNYSIRDAYCKSLFDIDPRPHWITTEFGGSDIRRVLRRYGSNIIFFNGMRDPWSGGGVLKNISDTIIAIVAKHGAHHVDLRFSTKEDPEWLREVRRSEVQIINGWLDQYYLDLAEF
ncbi:hypothetical protein Droror1_Dr00013805 [Drosera rotundifolia]